MTGKEKILVMIESLLNETNYEPFTDEVFGRINTLKELKSYIDSLQEESVSEGIEEALANEAPEKIYLEWYRIGDKKYRDWVITPKTNNEPIEYTRTDAFIEKACEWLSRHFYDKEYEIRDDEGVWIDADCLIEDFEKYLKE